MAYEIPGYSFTLVAGEDLTQYCAVDVEAATGQVISPSGTGARAIGVVQNKPTDGKAATLVCSGVTKMLVGAGGITAGDNITVDTDGKALTAVATNRVLGIALKTNAAGTLGTVLLQNNAGAII